MMATNYFIAALVASFYIVVHAAKPEIVLYNEKPPAVTTFVATTSEGSDNQLCLPRAIKTTRICVNSGIWIIYPDPNFLATTANASIFYNDNSGGVQNCSDLPYHLDKAIGSYRPAGDPTGSSNCTLNLYVDRHYAATERLVTGSSEEMPFAFNSAIRSGDCEWQFYMREGYSGFSECLRGNEAFVEDFTARFGVQAGDIKSIKNGCDKPYSKLNPNHVFNGYN